MKYIRTKDGIYELAVEITITEFQVIDHLHNRAFLKSEIISQADTIEELCDEFVVASKTNHFHTLYATDTYSLTRVASDIINMRDKYDIYGAIWTDKGLIYVAKMDDKGELELI